MSTYRNLRQNRINGVAVKHASFVPFLVAMSLQASGCCDNSGCEAISAAVADAEVEEGFAGRGAVAEDLDAFVESLESKGGFRNVLAVKEQTSDTGLIEAVIEGTYVQPERVTAR